MKLTAHQLEQFDRDGYVFFPELFSPSEVAVLTAELPRIFALDRSEILRAESGEIRGALAMERYSEPFARLLRHPRLVEPAHQVLGGRVYGHQYKVIAKEPFGDLDFPWHQDFASWRANDGMPEPLAMNYAVFLDEVSEFNGPITLIPGSHRDGCLPSEARDLPGSTPLYSLDEETVRRLATAGGMVAPKGPPGSGIFFHGCMAHASGANLSPWPRHIVYLTCNRVDNHIRRPTRPDHFANQDFTAIEPLADNCLMDLAGSQAAEVNA